MPVLTSIFEMLTRINYEPIKNHLMKNRIYFLVAVFAVLVLSCSKENEEEKTYPTDGLVSYFNFDDNLSDQMGHVPAGTNNGGAIFTAGQAGKAISFNGSGQYIDFGERTFKSGNNISASIWVKRTGNAGLYFLFCNDFAMFTHADGYAGMAISIPDTFNAHGNITKDEWTHLAGTYDGTNIKAYINGALAETKSWPGNIADLDETFKIGMFFNEFWSGSVDELFIYNKVLSAAEVEQLYNYHK